MKRDTQALARLLDYYTVCVLAVLYEC